MVLTRLFWEEKNKVKIIDDQPGQSVRKTQSCFCLPDIVREDTML